jgi:hypothetical protein
MENGVLRVYQIKGNAMTSLVVNPSTGCPNDKNGAVWFSGNWNGAKTIEQILKGGNLVAH